MIAFSMCSVVLPNMRLSGRDVNRLTVALSRRAAQLWRYTEQISCK